MPVTVAQILDLAVLKEARVLAGREGLDRRVTSVTVGEVPDIADWLSGGEMVLSTLYAVSDDVERQREFCRRVMLADAAALFVKTTRFVGSIPDDVIRLADKRRFPIIEVPQSLRWTRLMQAATEVIINRQASLLEQSEAIHRSLLGVVIRGGGWKELVEETSRLLERPVVVLDVWLEVLAASQGLPLSLEEFKQGLERPTVRAGFNRLGRGEKLFVLREEGLPALFALPIVAGHQPLGYVCVVAEGHAPTTVQQLVLEHSATIAALEMAQDRVRFETEVRLKGDFVDDVISGEAGAGDSLLRRGAFLGCDLSRGAAVMLLGVEEAAEPGPSKGGLRTPQSGLNAPVERLFTLVSRHLSASEPSSLASLKSNQIVIFVSGDTARDPAALCRLAEVLQGMGRSAGTIVVSAGISSFIAEAAHLDRGYQEALVALKVGRKLNGPGSCLHFRDVGTYRLLLEIWERDPEEIRLLYEETVGPIDRYDQANKTQLLETLITFFRNDENLTKTAADLFAHRHTIRYRLEKIAELSGLSVFRTEHKERLGLGLKARSLLQG
jgi:purine catabolism regulator